MAQIDHTFSFGGSNHNQGQQVVPFPTNKGSLKVLPLHGNLEILVKEAKSLPNLDMFHKTLGDRFSKIPVKLGNKIEGHLGGKNRKNTSDPYVTISISDAVIARTFVINNNENPVWMQHFDVPVAHHAAELISGMKIEGIFPVIGSNGKPCKAGASLSLSIQFTPVEKMAIYQQGVRSGPGYSGVPGTYFPLRRGGKVTLYQDAHVHDGCLPDLKLDGDIQFEHRSCWDDICSAIGQARRLIYITGWSVYYKVKLLRDGNDGRDCTLGDLLKTKSQEGVRVLLLVWDDPFSKSIFGNPNGKGCSCTPVTRRLAAFFKHSSVQVLLCPRSAGKGHSFIKKKETRNNLYAPSENSDSGYRCRTLQTVHKDDFHNATFAEPAGAGCPRQPWHDLHCQVDGPAAYDILTNFEERWLNASKPRGMRKTEGIERLDEILGIAELPSLTEDDPEVWNVQVFRSIDSNSVKGFPDDPKDATSMNLACGKNVIIDMSIHTAYVNAIRAAQHFIYIENQYFLGSSYNWDSHSDSGANNLIPMEIALKIAEKIRAHERFSAYILIPMWPEGVPTSPPIQSILFWQDRPDHWQVYLFPYTHSQSHLLRS
ncbi:PHOSPHOLIPASE D [Salix purpurea]|uniref:PHOSPHOLIPASE D n=1 Tax=Salix purpurea TaxID=77065 RepID=A0A9Q0TJ04_SALPP|nr:PHOSPHOLIPASE D [Salix purpurea]